MTVLWFWYVSIALASGAGRMEKMVLAWVIGGLISLLLR
jgi:hypothetical protein